MLTYVLIIVVLAIGFDFINGFHDSANSIATIVGTRVLSPLAAVVWAATFNFVAAFFGNTAVANIEAAAMQKMHPSIRSSRPSCSRPPS